MELKKRKGEMGMEGLTEYSKKRKSLELLEDLNLNCPVNIGHSNLNLNADSTSSLNSNSNAIADSNLNLNSNKDSNADVNAKKRNNACILNMLHEDILVQIIGFLNCKEILIVSDTCTRMKTKCEVYFDYYEKGYFTENKYIYYGVSWSQRIKRYWSAKDKKCYICFREASTIIEPWVHLCLCYEHRKDCVASCLISKKYAKKQFMVNDKELDKLTHLFQGRSKLYLEDEVRFIAEIKFHGKKGLELQQQKKIQLWLQNEGQKVNYKHTYADLHRNSEIEVNVFVNKYMEISKRVLYPPYVRHAVFKKGFKQHRFEKYFPLTQDLTISDPLSRVKSIEFEMGIGGAMAEKIEFVEIFHTLYITMFGTNIPDGQPDQYAQYRNGRVSPALLYTRYDKYLTIARNVIDDKVLQLPFLRYAHKDMLSFMTHGKPRKMSNTLEGQIFILAREFQRYNDILTVFDAEYIKSSLILPAFIKAGKVSCWGITFYCAFDLTEHYEDVIIPNSPIRKYQLAKRIKNMNSKHAISFIREKVAIGVHGDYLCTVQQVAHRILDTENRTREVSTFINTYTNQREILITRYSNIFDMYIESGIENCYLKVARMFQTYTCHLQYVIDHVTVLVQSATSSLNAVVASILLKQLKNPNTTFLFSNGVLEPIEMYLEIVSKQCVPGDLMANDGTPKFQSIAKMKEAICCTVLYAKREVKLIQHLRYLGYDLKYFNGFDDHQRYVQLGHVDIINCKSKYRTLTSCVNVAIYLVFLKNRVEGRALILSRAIEQHSHCKELIANWRKPSKLAKWTARASKEIMDYIVYGSTKFDGAVKQAATVAEEIRRNQQDASHREATVSRIFSNLGWWLPSWNSHDNQFDAPSLLSCYIANGLPCFIGIEISTLKQVIQRVLGFRKSYIHRYYTLHQRLYASGLSNFTMDCIFEWKSTRNYLLHGYVPGNLVSMLSMIGFLLSTMQFQRLHKVLTQFPGIEKAGHFVQQKVKQWVATGQDTYPELLRVLKNQSISHCNVCRKAATSTNNNCSRCLAYACCGAYCYHCNHFVCSFCAQVSYNSIDCDVYCSDCVPTT